MKKRTDWTQVYQEREKRALLIKEAGSLKKAVMSGTQEQFCDITVTEVLVLGLLNQNVRKYIGIFGHGTTDLGEVLRSYQAAGLVQVYNVRHETEASHAATQLKWQYGETAAVFTSIGPGALHALAGSLVPQSNGLGVYYIFGDETTHNEGPNMQQIPKREQDLYLKLVSVMGKGYTLNDGNALFSALKWGWQTTQNPAGEEPFHLLLPMNIQSAMLNACNLLELPESTAIPVQKCADEFSLEHAAELIGKYEKITVKIGGGARGLTSDLMDEFLTKSGAAFVHGPGVPGVIPYDHPHNMTVGGSKGSLSGNYAMEQCELLIAIGARGVCQWDSSGTAWKEVKQIININSTSEDALHYNRTLPIIGDAEAVLKQVLKVLESAGIDKSQADDTEWLQSCSEKKSAWDQFKQERYNRPVLFDEKWQRELLTQPSAIKSVSDFADSVGAVKLFDAGDVQANGFQAIEDIRPGQTYSDTGASYMGFAVSALLASAIADKGKYSIAFTGDGSFMMSPQILLDGVQHNVKGMIVLFDNRRMAAISGLQHAQYGKDFATDDAVEVDYLKMCEAFKGVKAFHGGYSQKKLQSVLKKAHKYAGLSVVYIPVYCGEHELGGLGAFGSWNVGNWCEAVQEEKHQIGL
ncbi:MAG: thiamine pyrophosphate-binding protein [bacterium]|nr:thiamine pyrophosphate-binding protein [bacterium]